MVRTPAFSLLLFLLLFPSGESAFALAVYGIYPQDLRCCFPADPVLILSSVP
jgi:hypothetical protein